MLNIQKRSELEIECVCDKHGGFKAQRKSKWGADGYLYTSCPICIEEDRARRLKEEEERLKKQRETDYYRKIEILKARGVTQRYLTEGFKQTDFAVKNQKFLKIKNGDFAFKKNALFLNAYGVGKSFLIYRMIELAYDLRQRYMCKTGSELKAIYKCKEVDGGYKRTNSFDNLEWLLEDTKCLIIDEVTDLLDDEGLKILAYIMDRVENDLIRVIIAGNIDSEVLKEKIGGRIYSRLQGASTIGGEYEDLRGDR